jgi:peptidase E
VAITGGHVAVLLNRLRFFGVDRALTDRFHAGGNIVAWSAGAMVLTERVVLFYDDPPDGPTHPEILDRGLGLVKDVVLLPHARQRLRLDDRDRVALLAQRFGPTACLGLENGAWLARDGDEWINRGLEQAAVRLTEDGGAPCLRCP